MGVVTKTHTVVITGKNREWPTVEELCDFLYVLPPEATVKIEVTTGYSDQREGYTDPGNWKLTAVIE